MQAAEEAKPVCCAASALKDWLVCAALAPPLEGRLAGAGAVW